MDITSNIEWITPEQANRMLDRNTHNRNVNQGDVLKWATEMEAGNWQLNGEAIKIADDGTVLDGQHRLHAVALQDEDVAIGFMVVRGLPRGAQRTMDQGRRRDLTDVLNLEGVEASRTLGSAVRMFVLHDRRLLFIDRKSAAAQMTTPELVEWAQSNTETMELLREGVALCKRIKMRPSISASMYAHIAMAFEYEASREFFSRLADGADLPPGSPILAFRNRLDILRHGGAAGAAQRVGDRDLLGMTIQAFNHWVLRNEIKKIQRPVGGFSLETFPVVITPDSVRRSRIGRAARAAAR